MWVVKVGGSLERCASLPLWLEVLAAAGGRAVVVPGGGGFAEAVRACERHWGLAGHVSHRMAIGAMGQFARMLCGFDQRLVMAGDDAAIRSALAKRRTPVWAPVPEALGTRPEIEPSWRVTSDSLAAWLAARLSASLILIKAVSRPAEETRIASLSRVGFVDDAFVAYAGALDCEIFSLGPGEHPKLARALAEGCPPGEPLVKGKL